MIFRRRRTRIEIEHTTLRMETASLNTVPTAKTAQSEIRPTVDAVRGHLLPVQTLRSTRPPAALSTAKPAIQTPVNLTPKETRS